MPEAFSFIRTVTSKNRHYDRKDLTIPNFNPRECCHFTVCINKCQGSHSALVSILKLGRRLLITFFEIQIKYSYVVNSKKVGGDRPPCPPSKEGPRFTKANLSWGRRRNMYILHPLSNISNSLFFQLVSCTLYPPHSQVQLCPYPQNAHPTPRQKKLNPPQRQSNLMYDDDILLCENFLTQKF